MGEGACFGMPTPEREAVSAPSWGTGLRPHSDLAQIFFNQTTPCVENPVIDLEYPILQSNQTLYTYVQHSSNQLISTDRVGFTPALILSLF
jgi:hypothetical protein